MVVAGPGGRAGAMGGAEANSIVVGRVVAELDAVVVRKRESGAGFLVV